MGRSARNAALLICLLALAGCNGLPGSDTATEAPTETVNTDRTTTIGAVQEPPTVPTATEDEELTTTVRNRPIEPAENGDETERTTVTTEANDDSGTRERETARRDGKSETSTVGRSNGDGNDGAVGG